MAEPLDNFKIILLNQRASSQTLLWTVKHRKTMIVQSAIPGGEL